METIALLMCGNSRKKTSRERLRFPNDFRAAFPQRGNVDVSAFIPGDVRGMLWSIFRGWIAPQMNAKHFAKALHF